MVARKIVIHGCGDCQHRARSWVRCEYGNCALKGRIVPETGIPYWCPLPPDAPAAPEIQPERAGASQPVAVSQSYTLLDAREFPPPRAAKIICGSTKSGTTVIGHYDPSGIVGHDCWLPMPGFPDSLKKRR